jgi:hypothetical protein
MYELSAAGAFLPGVINMSWPEIVLFLVIIAITAGAVVVWRKRE